MIFLKSFYVTPIASMLLMMPIVSCGNITDDSSGKKAPVSLADARKGFTTRIIKHEETKSTVDIPPKKLFSIVYYQSNIGKMAAYLATIPDDGKLHPAMIWITGGFGNEIGDVWTAQNADNDQSAAVIGKAGVIMMYPSQRGGHTNPGADETCFGEIDDILAAAAFLSGQKGIDPGRIYLGGHSTGGTKAILAAECSRKFRAVFALGPVASPKDYGDEYLTFDTTNSKELELREPVRWLRSLQSPVYVFEGTNGNIYSLRELRQRASHDGVACIHFYEVKGKNHFSAIRPVCELIAQDIIRDKKEAVVNMDFSNAVETIH